MCNILAFMVAVLYGFVKSVLNYGGKCKGRRCRRYW